MTDDHKEQSLPTTPANLAGWDKPIKPHEPLDGQLPLFDRGDDLPGVKDLKKTGQGILFDVDDE